LAARAHLPEVPTLTAAFPLGRVVANPGALTLLEEYGEDPLYYLARHRSGVLGELDEHDRRKNELSLKHGWRVVSSYPVREKTIWIITEADRSYTTILLPEEY
jgi:hypothetical protein